MVNALLGEQGAVELLPDQDVSQLVDEGRQVVAVDDLPPRALRKFEVGGKFGVGQDDDVVPAQASLGPAGVLLDVVAQRVAGFAGLADRVDLVVAAAAFLPPAFAVVPDLAALDFDADNAGAFDADDEVDLVVLEVISHPLSGDDQVVRFEMVGEGLPGAPLRGVSQARRLGGSDSYQLTGSRFTR